jgi:hypothetical protein
MTRSPKAQPTERVGYVITNLIKLGGLVLAMHEGFGNGRPIVIGVAALMLAGAQSLESFLTAFFGGGK